MSVNIFSSEGRLVDSLESQPQALGVHDVTWKPVGAAAGVYYYRVSMAERRGVAGKVVYLR